MTIFGKGDDPFGSQHRTRSISRRPGAPSPSPARAVLGLLLTAGVVLVSGCGGSSGGANASKPSSTPTVSVHPGTSPQSASELKRRLVAAGISAADTAAGTTTGAIAALAVDVPAATMVVAFFRTRADAEAYAAPGASGVAAGRGLEQVDGKHVYLLGADNRVSSSQRRLFNHVVVVGEGG